VSATGQEPSQIALLRTLRTPCSVSERLGTCLALREDMNALLAAPLGIAAALAGTLADATAQAAGEPEQQPLTPAGEVASDLLRSEPPAPDLLAPELSEAAARLEASDPAKICDDKCKAVALTETILPNTGAADLLSVALEPEEHGLTIPKSDGTPAVTINVFPTKITRGEGLVATAKF
jgi:hypothetical protein